MDTIHCRSMPNSLGEKVANQKNLQRVLKHLVQGVVPKDTALGKNSNLEIRAIVARSIVVGGQKMNWFRVHTTAVPMTKEEEEGRGGVESRAEETEQ